MGRYTIRRVAQLVAVFIGVTLLIYLAVFALPGDPIRGLAGDRPLSAGTIATLRQHYHLDEPFFAQYGLYLGNLVHGDLGTDFFGRSVSSLMGERWPITLRLAATAWFFEIVFGVGFGIIAALRRGKASDHAILLISTTIISIPAFVLAYTAQLLLGVDAGIFPVAGIDDGWPRSYLLPAIILGAFGFASVARLVRASVIENLRADYVRTAYAKGLSTKRVIVRHVLRNSLIAAITFLALDLGYLLGGTVIIEGVFNLPGIGQLLFTSIQQKQGAVVVGVATLLVMIFLALNLLVDLLYGLLDPRIRLD